MSRPSDRPTGAIWRLLEMWSADHELHPNQKQMAGMFEISDSLLGAWKYMDSVIQPDDVDIIATKTNLPRQVVQAAADEDRPHALETVAARRVNGVGRKRKRS